MEAVISPDWWGLKYGFVSGGFLGRESKKRKSATEKGQNSNKRRAFLEDDQENLYNLVQVSQILLFFFFSFFFGRGGWNKYFTSVAVVVIHFKYYA